jgi:hypothetical protein
MTGQRIGGYAASIATLALSISLAACGGGGGSSSSSTGATTTSVATGATSDTSAATTKTPPTTVAPTSDGKLHAACTSCGASDDQTYSGQGVGLWQALNTGTGNDAVDVSIANVAGRDVTLVFTSEGDTQTMPPVTITAGSSGAVSKAARTSSAKAAGVDGIHEFNRNGWSALTDPQTGDAPRSTQHAATQPNVVGSTTRNFWVGENASLRATTLEGTQQTSDGTVINVWVETSEFGTGKMTTAIVQEMLDAYARTGGVYDMVTSLGGPVWGETKHTGLIAASGQPIDLVIVNFNPDGKAFGELGYFYSLNNFLNQGSGVTQTSNQDLSLYLDSETLYLGGTIGRTAMKTVMAHESQHMQSFYRRGMLMGSSYVYSTWLEEMMSMMMEDWTSYNLEPSYNSVRDDRFRAFLAYNGHGSYACGLDTWDAGDSNCDSYSTNGAFGGYLNRQLGLAFYKAILTDKSSTDSMTALNNVINQFRPGSSAATELRYFTATAESLIPLSANMPRYSLPSRSEGGFTLVAVDPSTVPRSLPTASPASLLRLSSFPAIRSNVASTYKETVTVPPNTTLTVVVQ